MTLPALHLSCDDAKMLRLFIQVGAVSVTPSGSEGEANRSINQSINQGTFNASKRNMRSRSAWDLPPTNMNFGQFIATSTPNMLERYKTMHVSQQALWKWASSANKIGTCSAN
jgi:hypothetical protein